MPVVTETQLFTYRL